jgi:hypothetical protein
MRTRTRLPSAGHYPQAQVLGEGIEIPVAVRQAILTTLWQEYQGKLAFERQRELAADAEA